MANIKGGSCVSCGADTKVVDSRPKENNAVIRRRECLSCGHRFNTIEVPQNDGAVDKLASSVVAVSDIAHKNFAYAIRMKRTSEQLSIGDLAVKLGVTRNTVAAAERCGLVNEITYELLRSWLLQR